MSPELITIWSYASLAVIVVIAGLFAFVCGPDAVRGWRELFTKAGDGCATCAQWTQAIYCPSCHMVRVLTPTTTLPAPSELSNVADLATFRRAREERALLDALDDVDAKVN